MSKSIKSFFGSVDVDAEATVARPPAPGDSPERRHLAVVHPDDDAISPPLIAGDRTA